MTKLSPATAALINLAAKEWARHRALVKGLEAQVRARIEAEVRSEGNRSAERVSAALNAAIDGGSTKSALKLVTTKDRNTFDAYLNLLAPEAPELEAEALPMVELDVKVSWESDDVLRIHLDPTEAVDTERDPTDPHLWQGNFEYFWRPADGEVFIDPANDGDVTEGIAVTDWLRADERNLARVIAWVDANPQI
jgi:hypothetical protein